MRKYKVVFIDDKKEDINKIMEVVQKYISTKQGLEVEYVILSEREEIENVNGHGADIVLFDCALGGTNLDFGKNDEDLFGFELMKKYRLQNRRTKIIFYSGGFSLTGSKCYDFTNEEIVHLINELHVYKIIPRTVEAIADAMIDALDDLDAVVSSLEDLRFEYDNNGNFYVDNHLYSISQLLDELKKGTEIGGKFKNNVYKMVLSYMMKFGGDED